MFLLCEEVLTILMFDDYNINSPAKSGRIDRIPGLGNRAAQASHVLHSGSMILATLQAVQYRSSRNI